MNWNGIRLRVLTAPWSRAWGLLGRTSVPSGEGVAFPQCAAIHTWFMRMPVDVVFVDADWNVLAVHERVHPWRLVQYPGAFAAIELGAGEAARLQLRTQRAEDLGEARRAAVEE